MKLENWALAIVHDNTFRLQGNVYGNPKFPDGNSVMTSEVESLTHNNEVVTLSGSVYELGEPDPLYEQLFPNAKERLFDALRKKGIDDLQEEIYNKQINNGEYS